MSFRRLFPVSILLCLSAPAFAETFPITIKSVHLGFPSNLNKDRFTFKAGKWSPVWVELELSGSLNDKEIAITVETPDADDVMTVASVVKELSSKTGRWFGPVALLKPGGITSEVTVRINAAYASDEPRLLAEVYRGRPVGLAPSRFLFLSVGSDLPGFRLSKTEGQAGESHSSEILRNGWVEKAAITDASELPDRWFGYEGIDLLILSGDANGYFWKGLAQLPVQRAALLEWVRHGGHVLISGGAAETINALDECKPLLPGSLPLDGRREVEEIAMVLPNSPRLILKAAASKKLLLQSLSPIPKRPYQIKLLSDDAENPVPLVVQNSFGLGRVTLAAFDLDSPEMREWAHREAFWDWLVGICGMHVPSGTEKPTADSSEDEDKYLSRLQNNLEFFEGIPVISFGWVALFLLAYILLIGPIEYVLLQRLFKRLELTWLTFPVIVAGVCLCAYFAAHRLKGQELRVNKIDLVETDLHDQTAYVKSWFTLFSPQNQNLDVELSTGWVEGTKTEALCWHGKPKSSRQSLFRRSYAYSDQYANGLEHVPFQVWSTKVFTGSWSAHLEKPWFESTLRIAAADSNQITGSITSHLSIEMIEDAQLFYRGHTITIPPLLRNAPRYLSTSSQSANASTWLHEANVQKDLAPSNSSGRNMRGDFSDDPNFRLWPMLFHELMQGQFGQLWNASERELDQSWRIGEKNRHEAILVARLRTTLGPAVEDPKSDAAPTHLLLNHMPVSGPLRQETYIRVYIPVLSND